MKIQLSLIPIALATLFVVGAASPRPATVGAAAQSGELADKVAELEKKHSDTQTQVQDLAGQVAEGRALIDQTVQYLEAQASSAMKLRSDLQVVEDGGFAVGQNWQSREDLLKGLRAYVDSQQKGLPGKAKKATADARGRGF